MQRFILLLSKIKNNQLISSSINTMSLRFLGIIILFGFTTYLTHYYDTKIIGQYDFIRTYLLIIGSVCILGTDQSILYFSGILKSRQIENSIKSIYVKMFILISLMSLIIFLILISIGKIIINSFFNDTVTYQNILKATTLLFFYAITLFNTEVLRALESIYIAELFRNTFKYISVIIGAILLLKMNMPQYLVDTFLIGFIGLAVISTMMIFKIFKVQYKEDIHKAHFEYTYNNIFRRSYPMAISTLAIFLLMSFDVIFIKKYYGDEAVAYYSIAVKLMTILLMIMNSVTITISTKISEYFSNGDMQKLGQTMRNSARLISILSIPVILILCFYADVILIFFGKSFLQSKSSLIILLVGQGICSLFGGVQVYLNMTGRQNIFQKILVITVIINLIMNSLLVPQYGMIGGALSYVISMFIWNFIAALIIYKKDKINVFVLNYFN